MARLATVPERRASFREERRFAALDGTLISQGHLLYRRPDHIEKITDWPQPERLVIDGAYLTLTEGNDPPRVVDLRSQPELGAMVEGLRGPLSGDLQALQSRFTLALSGTMADWTLALTPKTATPVLKTLTLTGRDDLVTGIRLQQPNGDEQWMQIGPG